MFHPSETLTSYYKLMLNTFWFLLYSYNITCSINTILNPYNHNLSVKLNVGTNEIAYKEKTLNKTLLMLTGNLRCAFQKSSKHSISYASQQILIEELISELHCRVYYCLMNKKMIKMETYGKCSFFTYNKKKDQRTNFLIKRFSAPSFFACMQITLNRKSIWHGLILLS